MLTLQADVAEIARQAGFSQEQWGPFQEALRRSAQASIDAFLERRPDFRELGKLLIAANILRCEREGPFFGNEDHWYPMLADKLDDPFDTLDFSNTAIVTFNYDRSLEQFLSQCLCNRHNKGPDDVAKALSGLRIIHVYGQLGPLDWQATGGRKYVPDLTANEVRLAAQGIQIIAEGRDDSPELQQAREAIAGAEYIIFLGMAYHPENMRRLGFPLAKADGKQISGSGFMLEYAEREHCRDLYGVRRVGGNGEKSAQFLRNNLDFLRL
jgi:hypothetical protein